LGTFNIILLYSVCRIFWDHQYCLTICFQGLNLLAMNFFTMGHDLIRTMFYVLSLRFKQIVLYYAFVISSYLLAKCLFLGVLGSGYIFVYFSIYYSYIDLAVSSILYILESQSSRVSSSSSYLSISLLWLFLSNLLWIPSQKFSHLIEAYLKIKLPTFGMRAMLFLSSVSN